MNNFFDDTQSLSSVKSELLKKWISGKQNSSNIKCFHKNIAPLSSSQKRIWYFEQLFPKTPVYNMYSAIKLTGPLNRGVLKKSILEITQKHDIIRNKILNDSGIFIQKTNNSLIPHIEEIDLSKKLEKDINQILIEKTRVSFNFETDCLLKLYIFRLSEEKWILLTVMHHLISDGWSLSVFFNELTQYYNAYTNGSKVKFDKPTIQYFDYIFNQNEFYETDNYKNQLQYWKNTLSSNFEHIRLPTYKPYFHIPTYEGKRLFFTIDKKLTAALKNFSLANNTSLFISLLSAFKVLLYRYSRQTQITVGTPIANRKHKEYEKLLGFFANTLILQTLISSKYSFIDFLKQVNTITKNAYLNQDVPFEILVNYLQPDRDLTGSPLFNIVFVLQNIPNEIPHFVNLTSEPILLHNGTCKFDLLLTMIETTQGMQAAFEYNTNLFDEKFITTFKNQFTILLQSILKNPYDNIDKILIMSKEEEKYCLHQANTDRASFQTNKPIHSYFEEISKTYPQNIALQLNNEKLTYTELNEKANQLANFLIQQNLLENQLVGLCLDISFELIISIIAILKIGSGYVPLEANIPNKRLKFILSDIDLKFIITINKYIDKFNEKSKYFNLILLDDASKNIHSFSKKDPNRFVHKDTTAYVIYTSGTTGNPKGVAISHFNVTRLMLATQPKFSFNEKDIWTLLHSYAFDFSVWEIWGALFHGAKLLLLPSEIKKSMEDLVDLVIKEKVTVLNITPPAFYYFVQIEHTFDIPQLVNLRYIIFGGAALNTEILKQWFSRYPERKPQCVNMFGITETTVHATCHFIIKSDLDNTACPIGTAIPDMQIYLLNDALKPVPLGGIGEIYIGGPGIAKGYLNHEELNSEKFIPNCFSHSGKLYKSGDLAKFNSRGQLEYIGRIDQQVKIRGYRMELQEITAVIEQHLLVKQAVLRVVENQSVNSKLVAYVLLDKNKFALHESMQFSQEQINDWNIVFDNYYNDDNENKNSDFNIQGWVSSYTRENIPNQEMLEWVENTVYRIRKFLPKKVLEIGFGTGLLLTPIAPDCEKYVGCDLSQVAIDYVSKHILSDKNKFKSVTLFQREATNFSGFDDNSFDTFILNSVSQYFPSIQYLSDILKQAISKISDGGILFIGDVRNYALDANFYTSVALYNTYKKEEKTINKIQQSVKNNMLLNIELSIHPQFFYNLIKNDPKVSYVEILYKEGTYFNEMNLFRYDAIIYINSKNELTNYIQKLWEDIVGNSSDPINEFELFLSEEFVIPMLITEIPNKHLSYTSHLLKANSETTLTQITPAVCSVNYSDISLLIKKHHYQFKLLPSKLKFTDHFDLLIIPKDQENLPIAWYPDYKTTSLFNSPLKAKEYKNWKINLLNHLQQHLPEYMIPDTFIELEYLPLTINGKLDENLLPHINHSDQIEETHTYSPAQTETEKMLIQAYSKILNLNNVDRKTNFFQAGGHSLLATQLAFYLKSLFNFSIPLRYILINPAISDLGKSIDDFIHDKSDKNECNLNDTVNLFDEVKLDTDIILPKLSNINSQLNSILLTGATGFIGVFLLKELLFSTNAIIYCLVRDTSLEKAKKRLIEKMTQYQLWNDIFDNRLNVVLGDLTLPYLGLAQNDFSKLSSIIDTIYHNGAWVNFTYPYQNLKSANVLGTQEILRFATYHRPKVIHHISTLYVFSEKDIENSLPSEIDMPTHFEQLKLGYTKSKWVAEHIIELARERNLNINIYRLGRISGESTTGICQSNDFFWESMRLSLQIGYFPNTNFHINLTPVDFACKAIIALSRLQEKNKNFHILNPDPVNYFQFLNKLKSLHYHFHEVSPAKWRDQLFQCSDAYHLLPVLSQLNQNESALQFKHDITQNHLKKLNLICPSVESLTQVYLTYFINNHYFPTPKGIA